MKINLYHAYFFFIILRNFLVYLIGLYLIRFHGFKEFKGLSLVKFPTNQQPIFLTIDTLIMHATGIENNSQSLT
jgi:hypothetical protein